MANLVIDADRETRNTTISAHALSKISAIRAPT
jgi:hypothetical protein